MSEEIIVTNLEYYPGMAIERHLSLVQGSSELAGYTELLHESREEAVDRMVQQAQSVGANAVLNVRFSTSSIASGAAEIFVYGTAVTLRTNGYRQCRRGERLL